MLTLLPKSSTKVTRQRVVWAGLLVLALVAYTDWMTKLTLSLTFFYLIPVCLFSWYLGKRVGYMVAFLCALVWLWAEVKSPAVRDTGSLAYWNASMRFTAFGVVVWMVRTCRELTEEIDQLVLAQTAHLLAEIQIRKEAENSIHKLSGELEVAEDKQRRQLAQDIHDTLGQNLSALKLNLQSAGAEVMKLKPEEGTLRRLEDAVDLVNSLIEQTRTLTFDLHPAMLDDLGLVPTIRRFAEQFSQRTNVQVSVTETGQTPVMAGRWANFLFRATKELVNNAVKHGPAKEVLIAVRWREDGVRLTVDDDGQGFAQGKMEGQMGLGLAWIKERMHSLGGELLMESEKGKGVRVILDLGMTEEEVSSTIEVQN